ncbi:hypothetical protein [Agromyces larvae]|uniref:Uncharacterized protein n=1 Tax=Agromyces larvae TaxID=2929802 RepID=A0ABY4C390_9MICO|nr:hypothetical protein [Agromyces larvae]UOE45942.1 hypothetical protein MTO99_09435 [Agromyces larvae]
MSRLTAANVQTVADNLAIPARELGLISPAESIGVAVGTSTAGIPWVAWLRTPDPERYTLRPSFLPNPLGSTAREAHATLTAALAALREASAIDRARLMTINQPAIDPADWQAFERGEIHARELQRRHNAPKEGTR